MTGRLTSLFALGALGLCAPAQAGLLTNFAASYPKYQTCLGMNQPASKCYKLYCDPPGILSGRITGFVDVPDPGVPSRFSDVQELSDIDPRYAVTITDVQLLTPPGRQRLEVQVDFNALNADVLPSGPVVIFAVEIGDLFPALGNDDTFAGFYFKPGDFVNIYDSATNTTTFYDHTQLQGVTVRLPEPASGALAAGLAVVALARRRRRSAA